MKSLTTQYHCKIYTKPVAPRGLTCLWNTLAGRAGRCLEDLCTYCCHCCNQPISNSTRQRRASASQRCYITRRTCFSSPCTSTVHNPRAFAYISRRLARAKDNLSEIIVCSCLVITAAVCSDELAKYQLHGIETIYLNKAQLQSMDSVVDRLFMKLFKTNNTQTVDSVAESSHS